jgi:hypothetical protein
MRMLLAAYGYHEPNPILDHNPANVIFLLAVIVGCGVFFWLKGRKKK